MKKIALVGYTLLMGCLIVLFAQCKKEPVCDLVLHVHKTTTGIDTADAVQNCLVRIGLEDNYADFAKAEGYTDKNGVFTHTFRYEALLDVQAVYDYTYTDENDVVHRDYFVGTGRVKLEPGETVEQYILVTEAQ
ncbi:MAG: hypothetical protein II757_06475 [Bacteroidales bacterium]|nr:hypothetical protein [Bacteroidales bacterium]MCR5115068.1 hypothetical protein [Bacteroidales bacterium]